MKTKHLSFVLVCLIFKFCASAPQEKIWVTNGSYRSAPEIPTQQTLTITGVPYDRVWEACENSLIRLNFEFFTADKNSGEIRVKSAVKAELNFGDSSRRELQSTAESEFFIQLSRADGKISVTVFCTYSWDASLKDTTELMRGREKSEVDRIIQAFKKNMR